jgi:hypothetical protein
MKRNNVFTACALILAAVLLLPCLSAYADCPRIENLVERDQRLQFHIDRGTAEGQLTASQSERLRRRLQKIDKQICYLRDRHCVNANDERYLNEQLTSLSVQIFRALHRAEDRVAQRP